MPASLCKDLRSAVNLSDFKQSCHAHAAADTHGCDHIFYTAPPSLKRTIFQRYIIKGKQAGDHVVIGHKLKRAQKYGFHGTLKPPMRLKAEFGQTEFLSALRQLAADQKPFTIPQMCVKLIGNFLAITPSAPCPLLDQLATNLVVGLDGLRQPPDELEIAKRAGVGLTKQQHLLLKKWGYPYVREEFRFHLTLSDALDQNRSTAILHAARTIFGTVTQSPVQVSDVAAVGESETGMFHLIERVSLGS